GAHVLISSRNETELQKAKEEIQDETGDQQIDYAVCDVTNADSIKKLVAKAIAWNGTIDVLVNNAGGPPAGGFDNFDDDVWQNAFELNVLSFVRAIRAVQPYMSSQ